MRKLNLIPPLHFTQLIDAEHDYISNLAQQLRNPALCPQQFMSIVLELLWRLVRHDVSEELVMRPAFLRYLGTSGVAMADHDRNEHVKIKQQLLALHGQLLLVQNQADCTCIIERLRPLLKDMQEHMNIESGQQIPALRAQMSGAQSLDLGKDYAETLILTPNLVARTRLQEETSKAPNHVSAIARFMNTDIKTLRQILAASTQRERASETTVLVEHELGVLGVLGSEPENTSAYTKQKQLKTNL